MTAALDHELRRGRITSSTIAGCLGIDPRCTPLQAWERILHPERQLHSASTRAVMRRGSVLEDAILKWGAEEIVEGGMADYAEVVEVPTTPHPIFAWAADSADALYHLKSKLGGWRGTFAAAEAKTAIGPYASGWGEAWTADVPRFVEAQCRWHLGCHPHTTRCFAPALVGFAGELRLFVIERDDEAERELFDFAGRWHARYIATGTPPPVTSDKDVDVVSRMFLTGVGDMPPDPAMEHLVQCHVSLQQTISPLAKEREKIGAQIRMRLGERELCVGSGWQASWKNSTPRPDTDWEAVTLELRDTLRSAESLELVELLDEIVATHTKPVSQRRLLTSIKKEK